VTRGSRRKRIPEEIGHLTRGELPMGGRLLRIEWLEGDDARAVHDKYFKNVSD
jgi:hypothetical protein